MKEAGPNFSTLIPSAAAHAKEVEDQLREYAQRSQQPDLCIDEFLEEMEKHANDTNALTKALLWLYTLDRWVYADLNRACREDKKTLLPYFAPFIKCLLLGIPRCTELHLGTRSQVPNNGVTLYRRTQLSASQMVQYTVGTRFIWTGFTSCSLQDTSVHFGEHLFVVFIPSHFYGKVVELEQVSAFPHECEILLPCNIGFIVKGTAQSSRMKTTREISIEMQYEINFVG